MNEIEKAIKDLKEYIQLWEDEQADEDLTVIIYKNTIESFKIAKQALEKQINKPLTLDEVKELKDGDVVWLSTDGFLEPIIIINILSTVINFGYFINSKGGSQIDLTDINKYYFLYRNKPYIADVSKKEEI